MAFENAWQIDSKLEFLKRAITLLEMGQFAFLYGPFSPRFLRLFTWAFRRTMAAASVNHAPSMGASQEKRLESNQVDFCRREDE